MDKRYALIIADDFNLALERSDRRRIMIGFCKQLSTDIANGRNSEEAWTFKSSMGAFHRLDYILHSSNLSSFDVSAKLSLRP